MTPEEARALAKKRLSDKRFRHSACVAEAAEMLAARYGVNIQKAQISAWLHDILKEDRREDLLQRLQGSDIMNASQMAEMPSVWHAYAGGLYVSRELGLDSEIAGAVTHHTTGRAGMTDLEKVILLADYISADRTFKGVDEVRELAQSSLDKACAEALRNGIIHVCKAGKLIDINSIFAFNDLIARR